MGFSKSFKDLPAPVQQSSLAVKSLQRQRAQLKHEYQMACMALEKQFIEKQQELNHRRLAIISGGMPTEFELFAGKEDMLEDDKDYKAPPLNPTDAAPIPDFWLTVIRNHVELGAMVEAKDLLALQSLVDIQFSFLYPTGARPDFKLQFRFKANDFFTNDILEKTYYYKEEPDKFGDFEPNRSVGTNIRWKRAKRLTKDGEPSFFEFFTPPVRPQQSNQGWLVNEDGNEDGNEELEAYGEKLEEDFTKGQTFKDEVISDAIDYFMHENEEDDEVSDWDSDTEDDNAIREAGVGTAEEETLSNSTETERTRSYEFHAGNPVLLHGLTVSLYTFRL